MRKQKIQTHQRPEAKIQKQIIERLTLRGWFVKQTHGNAYSAGWPDLFATHPSYGQRWIEVKLPNMKGSKFTTAQLLDFPKFVAFGSGVWVLTGSEDSELEKLMKSPNWWQYLSL